MYFYCTKFYSVNIPIFLYIIGSYIVQLIVVFVHKFSIYLMIQIWKISLDWDPSDITAGFTAGRVLVLQVAHLCQYLSYHMVTWASHYIISEIRARVSPEHYQVYPKNKIWKIFLVYYVSSNRIIWSWDIPNFTRLNHCLSIHCLPARVKILF